MEKMSELTISDVKELTEGKKVTVTDAEDSIISIQMKGAILIADPDASIDGKITLLESDTGCKIELDSDKLIKSIYGNENTIIVQLDKGMGGLVIDITGNIDVETDHVINQGELCQFIKSKLDRLSKLTVEDIGLILNTEMKYLQSKRIAD